MKTPRTPDPNRPPMVVVRFRLETVHMERLQQSGSSQVPPGEEEGRPRYYHRNKSYNTLAKVVRAAVDYFLRLDAPDQECPVQMRKRKSWVKADIHKPPPNKPYADIRPAKRFLVQIPEEQHRALKRVQVVGSWPTLAEIILTALDLWLPTEFIVSDEQAWMREHDLSRDAWVERPRPLPPEGTFRTVEEHNAWRNATHSKPRPKRRIYKKRKEQEK